LHERTTWRANGCANAYSHCGATTSARPRYGSPGAAGLCGQLASCHGDNAQGAPNWQQPNQQGNLPPPHDASGHTWRHSDGELYQIIRDGWRDPFNKTPELTMPPFRDQLNDQEIRVVIIYFRSLWTPEQRHYQWEQSQDEPFPSG
jgi:hypothetical protein